MNLKIDLDLKEPIQKLTRDALITGDLGQLWVDYCELNNVDEKIKNGFLDYINKWVDENINGRLTDHTS